MITLLITLLVLWYLIPHIVLYMYPVPKVHKQFLVLSLKSLLILIPGFLAPVVVPVALLFTKWEDDQLPALFKWWDNDVSINGDHKEDWALDNKSNAYYADAPPRSFWARYVWLGWRNRCSKLVEMLGYEYLPGEFESRKTLGDTLTSRSHEGYRFTYTENISQLMIVKRLGKVCLRFNWGYKFFDKPITPSATITMSILSFHDNTNAN